MPAQVTFLFLLDLTPRVSKQPLPDTCIPAANHRLIKNASNHTIKTRLHTLYHTNCAYDIPAIVIAQPSVAAPCLFALNHFCSSISRTLPETHAVHPSSQNSPRDMMSTNNGPPGDSRDKNFTGQSHSQIRSTM